MVQPEEATGLAPAEPVPFGAQILDLSDLLERSLRKEKAGDETGLFMGDGQPAAQRLPGQQDAQAAAARARAQDASQPARLSGA